ncbi:MAG: CPBP family intramembrane metalloprotease [Bacteroidales bacterium]|nr:CPBP family intramembrane metalloprotease [Bacteroidales bacterium]
MALAVVVGNLLALGLVYLILKKSKANLSQLVRMPQGGGMNALFLVLGMGILTIGGILISPSVFKGVTISYISDIVLAPICEETLYRYIFFCGLLVTFKSPIKVIIITSILFGLTHFNNIGHIIDTTIMGAILGFTYWRTQSLITCILMHSFSNIIIILFNTEMLNWEIGNMLWLGILCCIVSISLITLILKKERIATDASSSSQIIPE